MTPLHVELCEEEAEEETEETEEMEEGEEEEDPMQSASHLHSSAPGPHTRPHSG